jgi:hypothetical protein
MKKTAYKVTAICIALLLLSLPAVLSARERRGGKLVITLKDRHYVAGELIAVKPDSLLVLAGKDESVDLVGIRSIRIIRKSKALLGTGCGYLASLVATTIYAKIIAADDDMAGLSALVFLPAGLGIGLLVGAHAGKDKTIQLEGMSESEVGLALAYLRGKARIRDYK